MVEEREREIRQIVQSISDLNEIFRDLAGMVVEQVAGAMLILRIQPFLCLMPSFWFYAYRDISVCAYVVLRPSGHRS